MSLYVPLVVRLELKSGCFNIAFSESSKAEIAQSPSIGEKTRRRLMSGMKKRSPPADSARDAPLAPQGSKHDKITTRVDDSICRGRRTYSEVVVETLEGDRLTQCSETSNRTAKTGSEPPHDIDHLTYYYGNPFVEKTEGVLHFYKYNEERLAREAQCRMLCMLAVPAHQTVRDLITFVGPVLNTIERIKIVRDTTPNQYMVIIKFKTHNDTVVFFEEFHGVHFNSMEPEKCSLLFVDRIECVGEGDLDSVSSSHLTEIPTCAVCLERMDEGVVSVLCNHTFHALCLQQWADTTCPVCRYIQTPEMVAEQRCSDCGQSTDLWICLICGNIGCGRYAEAHAYRHFELTSHTFCLQIGGERVWDYAGDNYVHRLIQTDVEGKLVEYERGLGNGENMDDKSEKLEGIKMEYTCLLSSQLESQRKFFEGRIADVEKAMCNMEKMAQAQMEDLERQLTASTSEVHILRSELAECQSARVAAEKKQTQSNAKLVKVTNELNEERAMNQMLRGDQQEWKTKVDKLEVERKKNEKIFSTKITDLEEQIRDLMLHFEAQSKIQSQVSHANVTQEEVDSSQIGVVDSPAKENSKQRRRSHKK